MRAKYAVRSSFGSSRRATSCRLDRATRQSGTYRSRHCRSVGLTLATSVRRGRTVLGMSGLTPAPSPRRHEARVRRAVPRHGRALGLIVVRSTVGHAQLLAVVHERGAPQGQEQDRGGSGPASRPLAGARPSRRRTSRARCSSSASSPAPARTSGRARTARGCRARTALAASSSLRPPPALFRCNAQTHLCARVWLQGNLVSSRSR